MIKDINAITPEYFKYRLEQETEQYKQEIERLNNIIDNTIKYVDKMSYEVIVDNPKKDLIKILKKEK